MLSVLITGASRGLGLEYVRQLLALSKPPQHLFACCRSTETAMVLQGMGRSNPAVKMLKLDVTDEETILEAMRNVDSIVGEKGLNLLINNAGIMSRQNCETVTAEEMERLHRVNVIGPLRVTQAFLPILKRAATFTLSDDATMNIHKAAVVNITSSMGCISHNTSGISLSYKTSKTALNMLTNCMAHDFGPYGILAVAMHPGWVQTDMGGKHKAPLTPEESIAGVLATLQKLQGREASGKIYQWSGEELTW